MAAKKRKDPGSRIVDIIRKEFGDAAALRMSEGFRGEVVEAIPTGLDVVDHYVISCGGWPVGRLTEVYSDEGIGKSSFMLGAIGAAQKSGSLCILIETEDGISEERAKTFGVDLDELILLQPEYLEQALRQLEMTIDTLDPVEGSTLIVWDSLAATRTKRELDEGISEKHAMDGRAKIMSRSLRILPGSIRDQRCAVVIVNQTRQKIGVIFGDNTTTPAGNALKFHASLRIQLMGGKAFKDTDPAQSHLGKDITVMARKTRFSQPFRKARCRLNYELGWDNAWANLSIAKDWKLIKPRSRNAEEALEALTKVEWNPRNLVEKE